jgi:hypothetical protein
MKIMIITDTYTHLYSEEFDQDRRNDSRAIEKGVSDSLFLQSTLRVRQCMI